MRMKINTTNVLVTADRRVQLTCRLECQWRWPPHDGPAPADDPNAIVAAARDGYAGFKDWISTVPRL